MVRILKSRNALPETFGRDWYSPANLYRGFTTEPKPDLHKERTFIDSVVKEGPWHMVKPKGVGMKFSLNKSSLTVSRIPIGDTDYEWMRLESDRLQPGYISEYNAENDETYRGEEALFLTQHKPGLNMKFQRLLKFRENLRKGLALPEEYKNKDDLDSDIKYFEKRIEEAQRDKFGRTYLYFVVRTKLDTKPLPFVLFPTKMHSFHDFDKEWHADPLFDTDVAFNILDQRLKLLLKETINGFGSINHDLNGNMDDVHGDVGHLLAATEHQDMNVARTIAIKRSKTWNSKDDNLSIRDQLAADLRRQAGMFRLPLDCYTKTSGVSIPPEYFEVEGYGEQLKWKYYYKNSAARANAKLILTDDKLEETRKQLENEIVETFAIEVQSEMLKDMDHFVPKSEILSKENKEELRKYVHKDEWPETTFGEYKLSLNSYKRTAMVYSHHLKHLLMDMKSHIFKDEKYINIECKPEVRAELLEWYEHCIDMLVPEMLQFCRELNPVRELGAEPGPVLYHPSEAKGFLKSAARASDYTRGDDGVVRYRYGNRRRARTPARNVDRAAVDQDAVANDQGLVNALEQENIQPVVEDEIDAIIRDFNEGRQYQLRRLVNILNVPIAMWNALNDQYRDPSRLIYDLQKWPHTNNNRGNWRLVKMLCQRWQQGLEVPIQDPRTAGFMTVVGDDWPNAIPPAYPPQGISLYAALSTLKDNDEVKAFMASRGFFKSLGLKMIPGVLAVLHKTFLWRISNPISTIRKNGKVLTTILPGCDWFRKIVFSLITTNGYVPVISPLAQQWLIPADFANADVEFFSDQSIYNAAGLTEKGYVINGEIVYDELNRRLHKHAIRWAQKEGLGIQSILKKYERDFNSTNGLGDTIQTFSDKGYLSDLEKWLGNKAAMLTAGFAESELPSDQVLMDTMAANWQQGQVTCYATEIRMYNQMNWLVLAWGIMSVASLFVDRDSRVSKEGMRTVDAIDLVKVGLAPLTSAGLALYAKWSSPNSASLPTYAMNIERSMFITSFIVVGQTLAAIIDSSVDPDNDLFVQRYVSDRKSWYAWAFGATKQNNPFKNTANEFVQQSRRFKLRDGGNTIYEPNSYRRQGGGRRKIWFNTDNADLLYSTNHISSNSRAKNIHYPPGFIFTYNSETFVVVDDLETMYTRSTTGGAVRDAVEVTPTPQDVIKRSYPDYEFEEETQGWDDWAKLKQIDYSGKAYNIFDVLKQFRVCYNTTPGMAAKDRIVIMSVAGKNTAQSIKNTLVTAACMSMMCLGMGYDPSVQQVQMTTGAMVALASIENNKVASPAVASTFIYSWFASSAPPMEEAIPMHFFAGLAAAGASQLFSKMFIPKPYPAGHNVKESLMQQQFGLLIPLALSSRRIDEHDGYVDGRTIWFGKLWDPIAGRLLYFQGQVGINQQTRGVRKHSVVYGETISLTWRGPTPSEQNETIMARMEDCFELTIDGDRALNMTFKTSVLDTAGPSIIAVYKYTPSPINRHLWFVKSKV